MQRLSIFPCMVFGLMLSGTSLLAKAAPKAENIGLSDSRCVQVSDASTVTIPGHLVGGTTAAGASGDLVTLNQGNGAQYFANMEDSSRFSGLYFRGDVNRSQISGYARNAYALEWEVFKQGMQESRRELDRATLGRKIQHLQILRDMDDRRLLTQLFRLQQIRNKALAFLYGKEVAALNPLLDRRIKAAANGYVTIEDVADIRFKVKRASLKLAEYQAATQPALTSMDPPLLSPSEYALINQTESVVLRPPKELLDKTIAHSYEHGIQALYANRSEDYPAWIENLSLGLYLERSREAVLDRPNRFRVGTDDETTVGMRLRIPLDYDRSRSEIVAYEKQSYLDQQQAVAQRIAQKVVALADRLRIRQSDLRVLLEENSLLGEQTQRACYQLKFIVSNVESSPDRKLDTLMIQMFENRRAILFARLDIFEVMAELNALVKPERPEELFHVN